MTTSGQDETLLNDNARWASQTVGAVLAGGRATRMAGRDKALIPLAGRPLVVRVAERLAAQTGTVIINANGDPARFAETGLTVVADTLADHPGPLAGLLAVMRWAKRNAPDARWVVTAATDTPFFPTDLVARFVAAAGHDPRAISLAVSGDNLHPTFGLFPLLLADDLETWLRDGGRKVRQWTARHTCYEVHFPGLMIDDVAVDPFFNINAPDDIEVAEAILEELK